MKKFLKRFFIFLAVLLFAFVWCVGYEISETAAKEYATLKEGDIIYQTSRSNQSYAIMWATKSRWTHCGIIIEKGKKLYVLEAIGRVSLTPLEQWKARGRLGTIRTQRVIEKPIKVNYSPYIGQPYDLAFRFNNGKMYCSELVYDIYKKQFGIELCKPKKVKEYDITGFGRLLKKRGIKEDQLVVSPEDLFQSEVATRILTLE